MTHLVLAFSVVLINTIGQVASHTSRLPSNTLLLTLSPPGQTFYLPPHAHPPSRSPTPSTGYTSDPESEVRKVKKAGELLFPLVSSVEGEDVDPAKRSRRRLRRGGSDGIVGAETGCTTTASWQDLLRFALTLEYFLRRVDVDLSF